MAWIRLDDQIAHHPKISHAGVSAWLWVCCIGYAQKFLTDGFIADSLIGSISAGVPKPLTHIKKLVKVGLLDRVDGGYKVHDYLEFNDSAVLVKQKREIDRNRKLSERNPNGIQTESERNPKNVLARAPASHPIPSVPDKIPDSNNQLTPIGSVSTTTLAKPNGGGNGHPANMRSKHPIFQGQRIVVFDWMIEDLMRMLGPDTNGFDLHEWFFTIDGELAKTAGVLPKNEVWPLLQAQLITEAKRRGLLVASALQPPKLGKQTQNLLAAVKAFKARNA